MKKIIYTVIGLLAYGLSYGQYISLTSQSAIYTQDFNTLGTTGTALTTIPNGWWISEFPGNTSYRSGDGSANSGDTYSFGTGTSTERSLGSLSSGSVTANFGARFINNTGSTFTSFSFDFVMEQWRAGGRTGLDTLYFFYSINNSLDSASVARVYATSWTKYSAADVVSKVTPTTGGGLDGNLTANQQAYIFTITGVTVNVGDTLWFRWQDPNAAGNDDGLSIDNFRFSVTGVLPVSWKSFTAAKNVDGTLLKWSTASESNNSHFEIQRSADGRTFESIARVKGNGTSSRVSNYSFNDVTRATARTTYYRLKQVDFDGKSEFSRTISVANNDNRTGITATLPNPFNSELVVNINAAVASTATIQVMDMIGKVHTTTTTQFVQGNNTVSFNTTDMPYGIYFVRVNANGETFTQKVIKK